MSSVYKAKKVLIIHPLIDQGKVLASIVRALGVGGVDNAFECHDALVQLRENNHDAVIALLDDGKTDAIAFGRAVRNNATSPNPLVPILAIVGATTQDLLDQARDVGVTDLLQAPYAFDDIAAHLHFVLSLSEERLKELSLVEDVPQLEHADDSNEPAPDEEDTVSLTDMLLDHYLKHHEIILMKLQLAQNATQEGIREFRKAHEKIRKRDDKGEDKYSELKEMWEKVIAMFLDGGLAEGDLFKIEELIASMPVDIKQHYDSLSCKDKDFLALVEGMNRDAYKSAKEHVVAFQKQPNPLNGMSSDDYKVDGFRGKLETNTEASASRLPETSSKKAEERDSWWSSS